MIEHNKATVRRLIEEVLNGGRLEVIDNLYARACPDREALDHAVPGQLP